METNMEVIEFLKDEILYSLDDEKIISMYRDYCDNYGENEFISIDSIDELIKFKDFTDACLFIQNSEIKLSDDYYRYNGYGYIKTYETIEVIDEIINNSDDSFYTWFLENEFFSLAQENCYEISTFLEYVEKRGKYKCKYTIEELEDEYYWLEEVLNNFEKIFIEK